MARNPAQIGSHKQLHTLYRAINAVQWPEFTGKSQILSANVAKCFQSRGELESSVQWWQVCIHAAEVWRRTLNPLQASNLMVLPAQTIANLADQPVTAGIPDVGPGQITAEALYAARYSALKARVTFTDQTAIQRVIDVDIGGGTTLSFCGDHVGVDVLYPEPGVVVPPNANAVQLEDIESLPPGLVLDSYVQASAAPAPCAPIGRRAARYTTTRDLQADAAFAFEIPAGAVEVTLYASGDASADQLAFVISPTSAGLVSMGAIDPASVGSGVELTIPGTARWIVVTPAALNTYTAVFSLEY
jgi:hypothetical protein